MDKAAQKIMINIKEARSKDTNFYLEWVPGHSGILGQDRAEREAKAEIIFQYYRHQSTLPAIVPVKQRDPFDFAPHEARDVNKERRRARLNALKPIPPALPTMRLMREVMERRQREVGRQALGCHGMVATEAVQGDPRWSSFEAREATSKITYDSRLRLMDRGRETIEELRNPCTMDKAAQKIMINIKEARSKDTNFYLEWVPGHSGILGQDRAEREAKAEIIFQYYRHQSTLPAIVPVKQTGPV
ncbi:hypothetical protein HPB47_022477 [Ixodes persulcatus]|uniref:Uncharacterized protein n=1 Tax=Ixodes persulcatus TaxID=34615 RepID=A0AC60QA08_IXOPE|nr:hypothetical protein HPB47_022477 [Ixodes persulcatus]